MNERQAKQQTLMGTPGMKVGKGEPLPKGSERLIKIKFEKELSETAMDRRIAPRPRQRVQIVNRKSREAFEVTRKMKRRILRPWHCIRRFC